MASKNNITGDSIQTKATTEAYRDNYDRIFNKPIEIIEDREEYKVPKSPICPKCKIDTTSISGYSCSKSDCPVFTQYSC